MKYILTIPLLLVLSLLFDQSTEAPLLDNSWQKIAIEQKALTNGPLILVNKSIEIQNDPEDLVNIANQLDGLLAHGKEVVVQSEIVSPLLQMLTDANKAGFKRLNLTSAYRSSKFQKQLYEQIGDEFALPPGNSEHQTGLAIDISITYGKIEGTKEAKWLADNGPSYGFILRYPENKVDVTGIEFEPWHFRYVGLPHSRIMHEKGFVLEEYIDFLRREKSYLYEANGVYYAIDYIEANKLKDEITYPWYVDFKYSGSNEDGLITTSIIHNPYK